MEFHSFKNKVIEINVNNQVAIATYEGGAEIIAKALNYYFAETYTRNQTVEMMHKNTANALESIADFLEKHEYTGEMAIEYLRDISEEMKSQAMVVSLRDELKFDKPTE